MPLNRLQNIGFRSYGPVTPQANLLCLTVGTVPLPDCFLFCIGSNGSLLCMGSSTVENPLPQGNAPAQYHLSINPNILAIFAANHPLELFIFYDTHSLQLGEFKVNLIAGLEVSLRENFPDTWVGDITHTPLAPAARNPPVLAAPNFQVALGGAYYQDGFFNVPRAHIGQFAAFGPTGTPFIFQLGYNPINTIPGRLNRNANVPGAGVRLHGNAPLAAYFSQNFQIGYQLQVTVQAPNRVILN